MATYIATTKRGKWIFYPLFLLSWCDCMLMFILYEVLHGETRNGGYIKDGHYFLHSKSQPHFTEVSQQIWQFSHYQQLSVFIAYPLTALVLLIFLKTGDVQFKSRP